MDVIQDIIGLTFFNHLVLDIFTIYSNNFFPSESTCRAWSTIEIFFSPSESTCLCLNHFGKLTSTPWGWFFGKFADAAYPMVSWMIINHHFTMLSLMIQDLMTWRRLFALTSTVQQSQIDGRVILYVCFKNNHIHVLNKAFTVTDLTFNCGIKWLGQEIKRVHKYISTYHDEKYILLLI